MSLHKLSGELVIAGTNLYLLSATTENKATIKEILRNLVILINEEIEN